MLTLCVKVDSVSDIRGLNGCFCRIFSPLRHGGNHPVRQLSDLMN
ncbi:hypothetical protein HMPREF0758_3300 [Serratia odorifera DSM 4582]|uniref:Uncharacterized protein n=1 Tax=Serratia odorifera DSM 4582 TaxID=667129 RepID=D4E550_SEROD|nr:hypothetical protein HMPREF0758_3300 [Serratia odorifera DSM 4582]